MILFKEDWAKYPLARPHLETKNRSWVDLAYLYKKMGVKNHAFHLAIANPDIAHLDPHDPMLSAQEILAIGYEVKVNPWYYFREVARVPSLSGNERPRLRANRGNIALWWSFFNHLFTFLIQIRQTGKSLSTDMLMVYLLCVMCTNTKINLLTKDNKLRRENIGRMKDIIGSLPYYLNMQTNRDTDNGEEITVRRLNNFFKTHLPKPNKIQALNAARGMSTPIMAIDEGPFQFNIDISLPAALASMGAAREQARKAGEPYGVIMTTTAGDTGTTSGAFVYKELMKAMPWTEHLFDCKDLKDLNETVLANVRGPRDKRRAAVNITLNHRQLGETDEWLRERLRDSLQEGEAAMRDFLNMWTAGTTKSPFSLRTQETMAKSRREVLYTEIDPKYKFTTYWYVDEDALDFVRSQRDLIIGLDSSEGDGGDYLGAVITDVRTGNTLGRISMNSYSTHNFIQFLADFLERFPRSVLIPEYKSTGVAIVDSLLQILPARDIDPFARIFNWIVQDNVTHKDKYDYLKRPLNMRDPDIYVTWKRYFGYATSGSGAQSRDNLYGPTLVFASGKYASRLNDQELITQVLGLERINGRIDHGEGKNDDLVIGWMLNFWFLLNAVNVHRYGIDAMDILRDSPERAEETPEQREHKRQQKEIRKRVEDLLKLISEEEDPYIVQRHEHTLRTLDGLLETEDGEAQSMEELLRKVREARKRRLKNNALGSTQSEYLAGLTRLLKNR